MINKLNIVGIGPGAKEYLTLKAVEVIENSDVLVGSKRSLELFDYVSAEQVVLEPRNIPNTVNKAIDFLNDGLKVSVLSTGDPGFSGMLKTIKRLSPETKVEVIPGISSIQLAAAKLEVPWDTANLLTIHGGKEPRDDLVDLIDNSRDNLILPNRHISELAEYLIGHGFSPEHQITICEKLSYPDEQVVTITLEEAKQMDFGYMCVVKI